MDSRRLLLPHQIIINFSTIIDEKSFLCNYLISQTFLLIVYSTPFAAALLVHPLDWARDCMILTFPHDLILTI